MLLVIQLTILLTEFKETVIENIPPPPRVDINNYNVLIDGRNFDDQPINDQIKEYDEIRKITTGKGDDSKTRCLLHYQ